MAPVTEWLKEFDFHKISSSYFQDLHVLRSLQSWIFIMKIHKKVLTKLDSHQNTQKGSDKTGYSLSKYMKGFLHYQNTHTVRKNTVFN